VGALGGLDLGFSASLDERGAEAPLAGGLHAVPQRFDDVVPTDVHPPAASGAVGAFWPAIDDAKEMPALPQPWWSPRPAVTENGGPTPPVEQASPGLAPEAATERLAHPIAPDTAVGPDATPATGTPQAAVHDARPQPQLRPRPPHGVRPVRPGVTSRPQAPTTRPAFLIAALLAIIGGTAYSAHGWLWGGSSSAAAPPAAARAPEPARLESSPLAIVPRTPTPPAAGLDAVVATPPRAVTPTRVPAPTAARPEVNAPANPKARTKPAQNTRAKAPAPTPARRPGTRGQAAAGQDTVPAPVPVDAAPLAARAVVPPSAPSATVPSLATLAATTSRSAATFEVSQVDVRPVVRRRVDPGYPEAARAQGRDDVVVVRVLVSDTGAAGDVRLLRQATVHRSLNDAAVAAVRQWTFTPARKRDRAVSCWLNVAVPFKAPEQGSR
jgi:protein TonB